VLACASRGLLFVIDSMSGLLQTSYYFAYMGLFCVAIAVMCGTIGFAASSLFVNRIYRNIKVD
jgi:transmembrane 9 superfamily protein 3